MLVEFSCANYRSFKERNTLSLLKAKGRELPANVFSAGPGKLDLLKTAAIYGANASGKSNFIDAIRSMRRIIVGNKEAPDYDLPIKPFKLDKNSKEKPSEFETVFIAEGVRYQYGFTAASERIDEEWLFAFPKGRAQRWFRRLLQRDKKSYRWEWGTALRGKRHVWEESTRPNALFLSAAIQLNNKQLRPVWNWFEKNLRAIPTEPLFLFRHFISARQRLEKEGKKQIVDFLKSADTGIDNLIMEPELDNIYTVHKAEREEEVRFDMGEESDGTQQMFLLARPWLDVLEHGRVLLVDELNQHLHPNLVRYLVGLFHNPETNPKNAQLVFTTHETSILTQQIFRRDQVWFCDKDKGASKLYPLTDFHPRKGAENLEAAYLSGRYGGVPILPE